MKAVARQRYARLSPLKVRQVTRLIKDKNVEDALSILHFTPKRAAKTVENVLRSAVANFQNQEEAGGVNPDKIYVKSVTVDGGPMWKRFRPMSMGRVGRIRRRTSHITIVVEDR